MKKIVVFLGLILAGFSLCGQVDTIPDSKLQPFYGTRHIVNMSGTDTMAFYQPGDTAHIMANDSIYIHQLLNHDITAGHYGDSVNYTWIASDTIAVESAEVRLYANDNFKGALKRVTVPADTFYIDTDNVRYIGAFWNSGNPEMRKVQDRTGLNMSDGVPLLTIYKQNGNKYVSDWTVGNGLMERMFKKDIFLDRYERQSGLILDTLNNMNVQVSSGTLWQGGRDFDLEYVSSVADSMYWYWYDGTNWQYKDTTDIIVDYYNDETGLQTLNNNRYVSVWFFRAVCCEPALFMVVDDEQYNKYDDAVTNRLLPANLPNAVTKFSIFLGRVVVEEDATAVDLIELSDEFTDVPGAGISSSGITDHGDMVGLEDDDHPQYLNLNGRGGQTISDEISLDTNNITNLADPVNDQDAATKKYVDNEKSPYWNKIDNYIVNDNSDRVVINGFYEGDPGSDFYITKYLDSAKLSIQTNTSALDNSYYTQGYNMTSGGGETREIEIHANDTAKFWMRHNGSDFIRFYQDTMDVYKYARFNGGTNISAGGTPTLQDVTDEGNTTDNRMFITGQNNSFSSGAGLFLQYDPTNKKGIVNSLEYGTGRTSLLLQGSPINLEKGNVNITDGVLQVDGTGDSYIQGNVGIGTTSPQNHIDIYGNDFIQMSLCRADANITQDYGVGIDFDLADTDGQGRSSYAQILGRIEDNTSGSQIGELVLRTWNNGSRVNELMLTQQSAQFYGNVLADNFILSSDRRLKHNVQPIHDALTKALFLNPVQFNHNEDNRADIGFIAQNVQKMFPELVHKRQDGYLSLSYDQFTAINNAAIHELYSEFQSLKKENQKLRNEVEKLKSKVNEICKQLED